MKGEWEMDELKSLTLEELVEKLATKSVEEEQIKILQEIGTKLINEYEICVGNLTIEPMLVEAYYYHDKKFRDKSVYSAKDKDSNDVKYARSRQQKNRGKLFIHYNDWGIDVCLTDSDDYYLSYLIKNALVNGEWQTQKQIGLEVCQKCSKYNECKSIWDCQYNNVVVLKKVSPKDQETIFVQRKGLTSGFVDEKLAALSAEAICEYDFSLPTGYGYGKQWKLSVCALLEVEDKEEAKKLADKKNGSKIEKKYWELAKESLDRS